MDIYVKSVDMDVDAKFHIRDKPASCRRRRTPDHRSAVSSRGA